MLNIDYIDSTLDGTHVEKLAVKCRFLGIELETSKRDKDMRVTLLFKSRDGEMLSFSRKADRNTQLNTEKLIKFAIDRENDDKMYSSASPSDMFDMLIR